MKYHEMLKSLRLSAGLTQKELGILCNCPEKSAQRIVQYWEDGIRIPSSEKLRPLAAALNVPVEKVVP